MRRRCHGCKYAEFECGHGEGRPRYTYYLLSTLLGRDQRLKRTYLWWGRYLTQFQMFQFVTNMGQVRCVCLPPSSVLLVMSRIILRRVVSGCPSRVAAAGWHQPIAAAPVSLIAALWSLASPHSCAASDARFHQGLSAE